MAFGRACLLGDAAFVVRPHAAAGTAKAAADAWALAEALARDGDVPAALARWETGTGRARRAAPRADAPHRPPVPGRRHLGARRSGADLRACAGLASEPGDAEARRPHGRGGPGARSTRSRPISGPGVLRPFPSDEERLRWFYTPTDHGGLTLGEMRSGAAAARHAPPGDRAEPGRLRDGLDDHGARERARRARGVARPRSGTRAGGTRAATTSASSAQPGADTWSWRFGGHHVSVHHTVVGGELRAFTPCFLGADPASSPLLGPHELRPLAACADLAFELLRSLTDDQRSGRGAVAGAAHRPRRGEPHDLGEGDGPLRLRAGLARRVDGRAPGQPRAVPGRRGGEGRADRARTSTRCASRRRRRDSPAAAMTAPQRELLKALLGTYLRTPARRDRGGRDGQGHGALVYQPSPRLGRRPRAGRSRTTTASRGHRLLVEYDNTTRDANHVHSVWRDPVADFGMDLLGTHRRQGH